MEIQNASKSKYNQLRNVNTAWESRDITIQSGGGGIDDRKYEVITFVVNAGVNVTVNNLYIFKIKERSFFVLSICFVQLKFCWIDICNVFFRLITLGILKKRTRLIHSLPVQSLESRDITI